MKKPLVVAVSGYSGSGKSTLINGLVNSLSSSVPLFFDDYASKRDFPKDIGSWIAEGGDPSIIKTPLLREHLNSLINRRPIQLVKSSGWAEEYGVTITPQVVELMPADYILLEEPFGKLRPEMRDLIDLVIYMELSLEVALGRRIHDLIKHLKNDPEVLISLLDHFLFDYLYGGVKEMYKLNGYKVMKDSDLVIDANAELADNVLLVVNEITKAYKNR